MMPHAAVTALDRCNPNSPTSTPETQASQHTDRTTVLYQLCDGLDQTGRDTAPGQPERQRTPRGNSTWFRMRGEPAIASWYRSAPWRSPRSARQAPAPVYARIGTNKCPIGQSPAARDTRADRAARPAHALG